MIFIRRVRSTRPLPSWLLSVVRPAGREGRPAWLKRSVASPLIGMCPPTLVGVGRSAKNSDEKGTAVSKTYQKNVAPTSTGTEVVVPDAVSVAMGELVGQLREGLLALAVGAGLQVMDTVMAEGVTALAGPKGRHDPDRMAVRHGTEAGSVVLGGRRVPVQRPRVRTADGSAEVPVPAYELFCSTELLTEMALGRMLAKLSTRRYATGLEPVGADVEASASGTSKSAISRRFVAGTERALDQLLSADLSTLDLVALMIDGVNFAEHCCVVALGIDITGAKHPLALAEGSTENATLARDLLVGLRERGLDTTKPTGPRPFNPGDTVMVVFGSDAHKRTTPSSRSTSWVGSSPPAPSPPRRRITWRCCAGRGNSVTCVDGRWRTAGTCRRLESDLLGADEPAG